METLTTTPFGWRPVTAGLLKQAEQIENRPALPRIDKWELFRELCTARQVFGVSDRDLAVLNALLSFHPAKALSDNDVLIVFPSNRALSERAHGMPESTLRRHLSALVQAGLIRRHDSPNGKRYVRRDQDGEIGRAFGFDLRVLLVRAAEIVDAAAEIRAETEQKARIREEITLLRRDAVKLSAYGASTAPGRQWDRINQALLGSHKALRRKLDLHALVRQRDELQALLRQINELLVQAGEMSGNDAHFERHHTNSNTDTSESELPEKTGKAAGDGDQQQKARQNPPAPPNLPLGVVIKACPDLALYTDNSIRHWHDLVVAADRVRGMMGISPSAWQDAKDTMGPEIAAITVAAMLQRVSEINSPGGYLRALTGKAADRAFSPGPMIMALLHTEPGRPRSS